MSRHVYVPKNIRRQLTERRPPRNLPETRDCIEFALQTIDRIRTNLDRIENMAPIAPNFSADCMGVGPAFALGRSQQLAHSIKTDMDFLRAELAACIPGAPPPAESCRHERLTEDGFCRTCSADRRGI
jgi:hypothetical protein